MKAVFPNLMDELEKRGMTYRELAQEIGLSNLAMYRRLVGLTKWSLHEAIRISWFFNGVDINYLFEEKERS